MKEANFLDGQKLFRLLYHVGLFLFSRHGVSKDTEEIFPESISVRQKRIAVSLRFIKYIYKFKDPLPFIYSTKS